MTSTVVRRTALVVGVANPRSLAWHSAVSLLQKNYNVIVTYQNERFESSVGKMVEQANETQQNDANPTNALSSSSSFTETIPAQITHLPCDVSCNEEIKQLFHSRLPQVFHDTFQKDDVKLDALVHSVAYAPSDSMKQSKNDSLPLLQTSQESFQIAHDISSYSLIALSRHALPFFHSSKENTNVSSSITALTYIGSTRAIPNYNVMGPAKASLEATIRGLAMELGPPPYGIRVNAVSAGPVSTLAARGIQNFTDMKDHVMNQSPLRRNVTGKEIGNAVAFLAAGDDGATAITGQVIFVDGGYSIV